MRSLQTSPFLLPEVREAQGKTGRVVNGRLSLLINKEKDMSRELIHHCDKCHRVIEGPVMTLNLDGLPTATLPCAKDTEHKLFDLCSDCWMRLLSFLTVTP